MRAVGQKYDEAADSLDRRVLLFVSPDAICSLSFKRFDFIHAYGNLPRLQIAGGHLGSFLATLVDYRVRRRFFRRHVVCAIGYL